MTQPDDRYPRNPFGHVDLRVPSLEEAFPFYEKVLGALGFGRAFHGETWKVFAAEGDLPWAPFFSLAQEEDHRPNANRIAFWVPAREEVDRVGAVVREAGGRIESGPRPCPEYSSTYYAIFFEDPCGNPLEVYHRTD